MVTETPISADAQSTLLLCAPLRKFTKSGPSSLTITEYNELAAALHAEKLRPSDLLESRGLDRLPELIGRMPAKMRERITLDRVKRLLERGGQLALALSQWTGAGVWIVTRADASYPTRYKGKLKRAAPPIVFGVGSKDAMESGGLAVVGSRDPDPLSFEFTAQIGVWAAAAKVQIVSGAARGVDERAMLSCCDASGNALGVVADSLLKLSTRREFREAILGKKLTLISSFEPEAGFTVGSAMARNRWIYALADRALVVASGDGTGGTWAGAVEALRHDERVYVKTGNPLRPGNEALAARGAIPAPDDFWDLWNDRVAPPLSNDVFASEEQLDTYSVVAPHLIELLRVPMSEKQFASRAHLTPSQAAAWLKRLIADGRVTKNRSNYASTEPTLFEAQA